VTIAFFDVDGTLVRGASSEGRLILDLLRHGRLGPRQAGAALWFFARWCGTYGRHTAKRNKAYLAGLPVAEIESHAAGFVRERLAGHVRPPVVERMASHRERGDTVILLTGTPSFIAAPLAALLEADGYIGSRCAEAAGRFRADPPPCHPFAHDKVLLAERLCRHRGIALATCAAYGDSAYDLPLLERAGHPVAVAPDAALRQAALDSGWEILDDERGGERTGWTGVRSRALRLRAG
jgi:HAD superfamily hydrolase (TIGR01490 family)